MKRLNVTIPDEIIKEIEDIPNKSQFIAAALKEKIEMIKKKELDSLLIEGYKATRNEDKKINDDWERVTID
ncbi:MAG: hypothetical protein ISS14_05360 [Actinobacteria bacterium]|nr:hypothetical protein [Actinomycetota bacterium]